MDRWIIYSLGFQNTYMHIAKLTNTLAKKRIPLREKSDKSDPPIDRACE